MSDPWLYHQDRHSDVKIRFRPDLGERWGQTIWRNGVAEIHLAVDLGEIEMRCTLAHELHHVIKGPPCRPLCPEDEADVVEDTARFLLPDLRAIALAIAMYDVYDAAERLRVTRSVLTKRLSTFNEDELRQLMELVKKRTGATAAGDAACIETDWLLRRRTRRSRKHSCRRCPAVDGRCVTTR